MTCNAHSAGDGQSGASPRFEKNDELNLSYRYNVGLLVTKSIIQSNRILLRAAAGSQSNTEKFSTAENETTTAEAIIGLSFEWFSFRNPKLDLTTTVSAFPSYSENGRVRVGVRVKVAYELVADLDITLNGYLDWDRKPQAASPTTDYGIFTALAYSFN